MLQIQKIALLQYFYKTISYCIHGTLAQIADAHSKINFRQIVQLTRFIFTPFLEPKT